MLNGTRVKLKIVHYQVFFSVINPRLQMSVLLWAIQVERFHLACKMFFLNHFCVIKNDILRKSENSNDNIVIHLLSSFIH